MATQRIAYIDFMKGFCILLVVIFHINNHAFDAPYSAMLQQFRIPMYFFLSGLFFKPYDGFTDFTRRKINNIIIPFLFFMILGVIHCFFRNLVNAQFDLYQTLHAMPRNPIYPNIPIWFLAALFEVNIIYYLLKKVINRYITIALAFVLSAMGYWVATRGYFLIAYIDIALVALPFFILGTESRKLGLLEKGPSLIVRIVLIVTVLVILYFFSERIDMFKRVYPNYLMFYLLPSLSIISLLFICQYLKRPVPIISHIGRYSIIVLGTHFLVLHSLPFSPDNLWQSLGVLAIITAIEYPIIFVFRKYLPRLTAQEPFFYERWQLKDPEGMPSQN